ncbi:MAG: hydrogenase formation protein HypD [Candidatus Bathyarchaeia archaeon]
MSFCMESLRLYRDKSIVDKLRKAIWEIMPEREIRIVHVCGTHEQTIARYGLRSLLPQRLEVRAGPGCPVCCVPAHDVDEAIKIATEHKNSILTTFGDMLRVPGTNMSLWDARAAGGDVRIVYSISDAVELARRNPKREVVFFAVGFETTAPTTAYEILNAPSNFSVLVSHRLIPPIMELLLGLGETYFEGFIAPGHVATIIGVKPFRIFPETYRMPTVVAGFEPLDVLAGVRMLLEQITGMRPLDVLNEYTRSVTEDGNLKAQKLMEEVFEVTSGNWRGIGRVPNSALKLREEHRSHDARLRFNVKVEGARDIHPDCSCHLVLTGRLKPTDCPLFGEICTPERPYGPCMVSTEGTCYIWQHYGEPKKIIEK